MSRSNSRESLDTPVDSGFLSAHIPVITIHSVSQETLGILHSDRDNVDAIHFDDYYAAYKLTAYYLAYLDVKTE